MDRQIHTTTRAKITKPNIRQKVDDLRKGLIKKKRKEIAFDSSDECFTYMKKDGFCYKLCDTKLSSTYNEGAKLRPILDVNKFKYMSITFICHHSDSSNLCPVLLTARMNKDRTKFCLILDGIGHNHPTRVCDCSSPVAGAPRLTVNTSQSATTSSKNVNSSDDDDNDNDETTITAATSSSSKTATTPANNLSDDDDETTTTTTTIATTSKNATKQQKRKAESEENQHPPPKTLGAIKKQRTNYQVDNSVLNPIVPPRAARVEAAAAAAVVVVPQKLHDNNDQNQQKNQSKPTIEASVSTNQPKTLGDYITVRKKKYLILGDLGKSMSSAVYRVQDIETSELRAIKIVDLKKIDTESAKSSIEEVKLLEKLQAPCVIEMYNCEKRDGVIYIVMENGDTDLGRFLREVTAEKPLPLTMILHYWIEMLTAVKHIHDNDVIHSDLKPANFLLVRGRLKLIDFGISSTLNGDMTSVIKNSSVRTLNYISPEALVDINENPHNNDASQYKINFKSDVWSLGCILYRMIYGRTPYRDINIQSKKIHAITNKSDNISFKLSPNLPALPPILFDVMKKCLQKNQKARPSVEELLLMNYTSFDKTFTSSPAVPPNISPNILRKIRRALDDDEWRDFVQNMVK